MCKGMRQCASVYIFVFIYTRFFLCYSVHKYVGVSEAQGANTSYIVFRVALDLIISLQTAMARTEKVTHVSQILSRKQQ